MSFFKKINSIVIRLYIGHGNNWIYSGNQGKGSSGGKLALYLGVPFAAAGIIFGLFYYRKQARFGYAIACSSCTLLAIVHHLTPFLSAHPPPHRRIRLPDTSSYTTNTPAILKSALAVLTEIPYFLASILSTIWILVRRLRMPSFPSNWFRGVRYSQLNQDDYQDTGLQMDEWRDEIWVSVEWTMLTHIVEEKKCSFRCPTCIVSCSLCILNILC